MCKSDVDHDIDDDTEARVAYEKRMQACEFIQVNEWSRNASWARALRVLSFKTPECISACK
jgi:hypothetical protein